MDITKFTTIAPILAIITTIVVAIITIRNQLKLASKNNEASLNAQRIKDQTALENDLERRKFEFELETKRKKFELSYELFKDRKNYVDVMLVKIYEMRCLCEQTIEEKFDKQLLKELQQKFKDSKSHYSENTPVVNTFSDEMRSSLHTLKKSVGRGAFFDEEKRHELFGAEISDDEWEEMVKQQISMAHEALLDYENFLRIISKEININPQFQSLSKLKLIRHCELGSFLQLHF